MQSQKRAQFQKLRGVLPIVLEICLISYIWTLSTHRNSYVRVCDGGTVWVRRKSRLTDRHCFWSLWLGAILLQRGNEHGNQWNTSPSSLKGRQRQRRRAFRGELASPGPSFCPAPLSDGAPSPTICPGPEIQGEGRTGVAAT